MFSTALVGALSAKQREALILKWRGLRDREIGEVMRIGQRPAVNRLRRRGRQAIERILRQSGSDMTVDEVIASMARAASAVSSPARSEPMAMAS